MVFCPDVLTQFCHKHQRNYCQLATIFTLLGLGTKILLDLIIARLIKLFKISTYVLNLSFKSSFCLINPCLLIFNFFDTIYLMLKHYHALRTFLKDFYMSFT